jgi:hypothetical protein
MIKLKKIKEYYFTDLDRKDMVDQLNNDLPVNIKFNEDLVDRVHARYPLLDKTEVSIIIKAVFQSIRDLLVLGKILNFNTLFFDTKLYFFGHRRNGHILPSLKVKITTPPTLRKHV